MAKKKQPAAEQQQPSTIDLAATLQRNDDGWGYLSGVQGVQDGMAIAPAAGDALIGQLAAQGMQTMVVSLRELASDGVEGVAEALTELEAGSVATWNPAPPEGEGWVLVAVLWNQHKPVVAAGEEDAVAVWARPAAMADAPEAQPPEDAQAHAATFMIGNLMAAAKRRFVGLAAPWSKLSEEEQSRTLRYLAEDVRVAVGHAIRAIASNERLTFRAEVESVQFKGASDVKAALKLVNTPESHALADRAGGFVTIVIEDTAELLDIPETALKGEADQPPLFDQSTEGTALDTKPEEALA